MYVNKNGTWKPVTDFFINVSGTWKTVTEAFINVAGTWKRFWSGGTLSPQNPVTISQSTNATTYLITLTGTNYSWTPGPPSLTYYFEWSTNGGSTWSTLASASAINPSYGSSTSYTHQITTAQFAGNVTNTYRFRVAATYGSQSASSSATTTVQGPTDITLTAGTPGASSIPVTWTTSVGAGRYLVEYKTLTSSTWSTYSWVGTTYETLYGLADNTTYNIRVTPYTSSSNDITYKGYAGNVSNTVTATTPVLPGNITSPEVYNFSSGNAQLFFTTGTNTTSVQYSFVSDNISGYTIGPFTQSTSSSVPYKVEHNLFSYFTLKTYQNDYLSSTRYYLNSTAWYLGNQYRAINTVYSGSTDVGFTNIVPTDTSYWTRIQTVTYSPGDYISYSGTYYFARYSTNGTLPTNTAYWSSTGATFTAYLTPYNSTYSGNQTNTSVGGLLIRGDNSASNPLTISSGPSFSLITDSSFRTTYIPSVYTNQVYFYIQKASDSSYVSGYNPKILSVSGATSTTHDTTTTLSGSTQYLTTITARYVYNSIYGTSHTGQSSSGYVTTASPLPQPPTGLSVTDIGTNRPYGNAAYSLSWSAPTSGTVTGYKIQFQVPSVGTTWYDYSSNTSDTSSTSFTATGFGSNLSTNFRVYSVNSAGQSTTAVATTSAVLGTTVPQAPTIGTATTSNTYISVTYTANATGGKAITSYTATSSPGSLTGSTSSGSIVVYNVVHNTAYTFTVTATNANGTSSASAASNTAYGVNIGSVTNITSSSTSNSITLNFTKATNSTSTRGYLSGSLDGTTAGTSYLFAGLSASTSYSLGLAGTAVVNGVTYVGPQSSGSYSTSALPGVTVNSYPTISGSGASGTLISFSSGSYNNAATITKTLRVSISTSFSATGASKGSSSPYLVTSADAAPPPYYFAVLDTVVGTNGQTYYFWSGGYSGSSVTIPAGSGSILSYTPSGTAPSTPTNGSGTFTSGSTYYTTATFTRSTSGTTPITYYWSVYKEQNSGSTSGPLHNSGNISSSTLGGTQSIPQQSWTNGTTYDWARYTVYASNAYGSSSTLTWWI